MSQPLRARVQVAGVVGGFGLLVAALLVLQLAQRAPQSAVAIGVVVLAVGAWLALLGLTWPPVAIGVLLVALFVWPAVPADALPISPAMLAWAGVLATSTIAVLRRRSPTPLFGAVELAMACFVLWNVASALLPHPYPTGTEDDQDFSVWRFILTSAVLPFSLYVIGGFAVDRRHNKIILWPILGIVGYSALVSVLQFTGPTELVWPRYIIDDPRWVGRAVGVLHTPVANGFLLIVGFVIGVQLGGQRTLKRWERAVAFGIAAATVPAIYLTHTRAVWLAFAITLVLGVVLAGRTRILYLITLVLVVVAVVIDWSNFLGADRSTGGVGSTREIYDRLNGIATSLWAIEHWPIAGSGLGTFTQLNTVDHQQWSDSTPWIQGFGISSHENELGIAAELGLVGLALWLAVLLLLVRRLARAVRLASADAAEDPGLTLIALNGLVVWLIIGTTVDLRFLDLPSGLVMLLAGIAVGQCERTHGPAPGPAVERPLVAMR